MSAPTAAQPITVRSATAADEPERRRWFADTKRAEFAPLGLPDASLDALCRQQYDARAVGYAQQFPTAEHLVVEADGEAIGALIVDGLHDAPTVVIVDVVVDADHRNRGIGRRVLAEIVDTADRRSAAVELSVTHGNPARRLYERLGFEPLSTAELHERLRRPPARKDTA